VVGCSQPDVILVTGAGGKTGRAVLRALQAAAGASPARGAEAVRPRHRRAGGATVRAFVRRVEQTPAARADGASEVAVGDMYSAESVAAALRDVRSVYYIPPNMAEDEVAMVELAIEAGRAAGVRHFVYHSVLHPQTESMPHHWQKLRAEERLLESGLPFTFLRPAVYMQNVLAHWERIAGEGVYAVPYAAEARVTLVDLADVARVAAGVLTEPGHEGATYELCGREILSPREMARILARILDRPVRVEVVPREAWAASAREAGLGEYGIATLLAMFDYYERHGLVGNPNVLEWLLRRPATTFQSFVAHVRDGMAGSLEGGVRLSPDAAEGESAR